MDAREYKEYMGRDVKKGLIPEWYRKEKRESNLDNKDVVWENLEKGKQYWFKKGDHTVGKYKRSEETLERIRNYRQNYKNTCNKK